MRSKISTLSTLGLVGTLALVQGGCVIDSPDDSAFEFDWTVQHVGDTAASTCLDVGAATVEFEATNLSTSAKYSDSYVCNAGSGRSRMLPTAEYSVVVRLKDDLGGVVSETSASRFLITRSGFTLLPPIAFLVQSWKLAWTVQKMTASTPVLVTCAQAGATTVQLETLFAGTPPLKYDFDCVPGLGRTASIGTGSYQVTVRLLNAQGVTLDEFPPEIFSVNGVARADLGRFDFLVN